VIIISYKPILVKPKRKENAMNIPKEVLQLTELINEFFGSDAMYYGIDSLALAGYLIKKGVTMPSNIL